MGLGIFAIHTIASAQSPPPGMLRSPFPQRVIQQGNLKITLGEIRMVMRGPMFPLLGRVGENSIMVTASRAEEQGQVRSIRSDDLSQTWRPYEPRIARGAAMNTLRLADGRVLSTYYDTKPINDRPGYRSTTRWISKDGWKTVQGPFTDGTVYLPPDETNYAPFFSTGYTDILQLAPGKFLCTFDCTPPQPWTAHATHWVGVLDIEVEIIAAK